MVDTCRRVALYYGTMASLAMLWAVQQIGPTMTWKITHSHNFQRIHPLISLKLQNYPTVACRHVPATAVENQRSYAQSSDDYSLRSTIRRVLMDDHHLNSVVVHAANDQGELGPKYLSWSHKQQTQQRATCQQLILCVRDGVQGLRECALISDQVDAKTT